MKIFFSCWASNVRHDVMDFPIEQESHEVTLSLINEGCATDYPPDLVHVLENGYSKMATFTVNKSLINLLLKSTKKYFLSIYSIEVE